MLLNDNISGGKQLQAITFFFEATGALSLNILSALSAILILLGVLQGNYIIFFTV